MRTITGRTWDKANRDLEHIEHDDTAAMKSLLLGRRVVEVDEGNMLLDNGTVVRVDPNEGCDGCTSGNYWLNKLTTCDNIITNVEVEQGDGNDTEWGDKDTRYTVFVVAEDKRFALLSVDGNDGNEYYGTGFELIVRKGTE